MNITGLYCGVILVFGQVLHKCDNIDGSINYHIQLDKPKDILGLIRKRVVLKDNELITKGV